MNALSSVYHKVYDQMTDSREKIKEGYSNLTYKKGSLEHPKRNQVPATALVIATLVTAIFRLAMTTFPSLVAGVTAGAATYAYQCYQLSTSKWKAEADKMASSLPTAEPVPLSAASQEPRSYSSRSEFVAKARTFAEALITKCQALWNKKDKEAESTSL